MALSEIACELCDLGVVQFGDFVLKSGENSPVYFDLRLVVSRPILLSKISQELTKLELGAADSVVGVPYAAIPLATILSQQVDLPLLIRRKEPKAYGTKKMVEGIFKAGDRCVIVEDVVTTGGSVLEVVASLREEGLVCDTVVCVMSRGAAASQRLAAAGVTLKPLFTAQQIVDILHEAGSIVAGTHACVTEYLANGPASRPQATTVSAKTNGDGPTLVSLKKRAATHPLLTRLAAIMTEKKSNLCFSADLESPAQLIQMVDAVGPHVCMVKTHSDVTTGFTAAIGIELRRLADKHRFILMEDRKLADIGHTMCLQLAGSHWKDWADCVTVHALAGAPALSALSEKAAGVAAVLVAEMSCADNLLSPEYTKGAAAIAASLPEFVCGVVAQHALSGVTGFTFMPGVSLLSSGDAAGQQYKSPDDAIRRGADVLIVGRAISGAAEPAAAAAQCQTVGWAALAVREGL